MIGSIIGGIGSVIGGMFGKKSADKANAQNIALQKEFAQKGVQWKVQDAKEAGVHPLYALGAQTHSFAPSSVGDGGLASSLAAAGQDIGSAIDRTRTAPQKLSAVARTAQALELERAGLQNDLLRAQIAETTARARGPAFPAAVDQYFMPGQGDSPVVTKPLERIASAHNRFSEAAAVTDVGTTRTHTGGLAPVYSADAKERLEDDFLGMLSWNIRNRLVPSITHGRIGPRPAISAGRGFEWRYDPVLQEWYRSPTLQHVRERR